MQIMPVDKAKAKGMYVCEWEGCGRNYTRKDHLHRHQANHSETCHTCQICSKVFKRLDLLLRHEDRKVCRAGRISPGSTEDEPAGEKVSEETRVSTVPPTSRNGDTTPNTSRTRLLTVETRQSTYHPYLPSPHFPTQSPIRSMRDHLAALAPSSSQPFHSFSPHPFGPHPHQNPPPSARPPQPPQNIFINPQPIDLIPTPINPPHVSGHPSPPPMLRSEFSARMQEPSLFVPPPSAQPSEHTLVDQGSFGSSSTNIPDFEIGPHQTWAISNQNVFVPAAWDQPIDPQGLPLHPVYPDQFPSFPDFGTMAAGMHRVQTSSERVSETVSMHQVMLRLASRYPDLQLDIQHFSDAMESYWTNVSLSFPFVHRGTFDPNEAPIGLVAMMYVTGSTKISSTSLKYRSTVTTIRADVLKECGLDFPISSLQTFCLCHVYDTWHGTSETLFVAQCMWPVIVAHSRKTGVGVLSPPEMEDLHQDAWFAWAKDEEIRRAAFCVLLIDTQISTFWAQHPSRQLSIFAHDIALPCPKGQWEALTADEWYRQRSLGTISPTGNLSFALGGLAMAGQSATSAVPQNPLRSPTKKKSSFLPGLHPDFTVKTVPDGYSHSIMRALAAELELPYSTGLENSLGVTMILMGIMAIAWDCRTRGGMGLKFRDGMVEWRSTVIQAVINLRQAWERSVCGFPPMTEVKDMRDIFGLSIVAVLSDIPMLQCAAGAKTICGAKIKSRQFNDAQRRLRIWVKSEDAYTCLWQSARYLQSALTGEWGIYTPWAVYVTTLVHWCYAWGRLHPTNRRFNPLSPDYQNQAGVICDKILTSNRDIQLNEHGILDLVAFAADRIGAVGEEGSMNKECADLLGSLLNGEVVRAGSEELEGMMARRIGS